MRSSFARKLIASGLAVVVTAALSELFFRAYFSIVTNYDIEMWRYTSKLKTPVEDERAQIHLPSRSLHLMNVDVTINSKGLRDAEIPYEKPPGTYRVIALGDSLTFGWGVPAEKTFPKLLERQIGLHPIAGLSGDSRVEIINMGIPNSNTRQELATFLIEGTRYHPDAVILGFFINDAEPTQKKTLGWFTGSSYTAAFIAHRIIQLRSLFDPARDFATVYSRYYQGENWDRYQETLVETAQTMKTRGIRFLPVLLPYLNDLTRYPFKEAHRKVASVFSKEGAHPVDLLPLFEGKDAQSYWVAPDDPHPNEGAHSIIAEGIYRALADRFPEVVTTP